MKCGVRKYRKVKYPKCPYCGHEAGEKMNDYNFSKLVSMANGYGTSDVVLRCEKCNEKFRVTCNITFYARKDIGE
jgi:hypothetical protein